MRPDGVFDGVIRLRPAAGVLRRHVPACSLLVLVCLFSPASAHGQTTAPGATSVGVPSAAVEGVAQTARLSIPWKNSEFSPLPRQRGASRDSLKNGGLIGAAVGAVALGTLAAVLCRAYQEEGGASCTDDTLRFAAIGAAIGSGVGLAVDVARSRRPGVSVGLAIRF